jgi:hypothetical protein
VEIRINWRKRSLKLLAKYESSEQKISQLEMAVEKSLAREKALKAQVKKATQSIRVEQLEQPTLGPVWMNPSSFPN